MRQIAKLCVDRVGSLPMEARYAGWKSPWGSDMLNGKLSLEAIAIDAEERDLDPKHRSGRQEFLENLVNRISDDATMG